jgi:hypothetical protein
LPNVPPSLPRSNDEPEVLSPADRRLIARVVDAGPLALPTDCPDLSPLLERLDRALAAAGESAARLSA